MPSPPQKLRLAALLGLVRRRTDAASAVPDCPHTDSLTGLSDRAAFDDSFELELERCRRNGNSVSVILVDLDAFRRVNARLGRELGDDALRTVAAGLMKWKRKIDQAARIGGEEFALIATDTGQPGAFMFAERLRRAVAGDFEAHEVQLTASLGIATFPAHGETVEQLLRAAGDALRCAKDLGGNQSVVFGAPTSNGGSDAQSDCSIPAQPSTETPWRQKPLK